MLARNPLRMDYYRKYQEIIAEYNREKDRATVEETFAKLVALSDSLDAEQRRAAEEGLNEDELALFDLLFKKNINQKDRERVKQASKGLLASLEELIKPMPKWTENAQTQAEVEVFVMNNLFSSLPNPPFNSDETEKLSRQVYDFIWQQCKGGDVFGDRVAI
jgi:type I restriction enzyme R subunit